MGEIQASEGLRELGERPILNIDSQPSLEAFQQKALSGISPEEMLDYIFETLGILVPFDRVGLALMEGEWLHSRWVKSRIPVEHIKVGYRATISGSSLEKVMESGQPRIINDLEVYLNDHPQSQSTQLILNDGMRSSLTFPLHLGEEAFGVVFFSSCKPQVYTTEHAHLLKSLAQGLAVVVEHAVFKQTREGMKDQGSIIARTIHDLRSPLSVISGFTDLLCESEEFLALPDSAKNIFSIIQKNTRLLLSLVDELVDLGALRRNPFSIHREMVSLPNFFQDTFAALGAVCTNKKITLNVNRDKCQSRNWSLDPIRVRQVLENLVSNAVKFSDSGSHVQIDVWTKDGRLWFSVTDQGPGIAEDEVPKLFQEFGTTRARPTAGEKSTGLGLAICKQIVQNHGGEISVHTRLHEGSTFEFWIPRLVS